MTIAVYTTLFGPYDHILPALHDEADYILFTDQEGVEAPGWQVRQVKRPHPDGCYASRFYFDQASMVLPEYYLTIMHGANAQLIMPPCGLVAMLRPDHDIACFAHAHRTNVYEEAKACIRFRKDDKAVIQRQMERYRMAHFPESVRLSTCGLLVRRNTRRLRQFEAAWWAEVQAGSCRDQLSFDYCRWRLGMPITRIPGNINKSPHILKLERHRRRGDVAS